MVIGLRNLCKLKRIGLSLFLFSICLSLVGQPVSLNYSTSPDVSTATFSGTMFSVAVQETSPRGLAFNNDGTKMYMVGFIGQVVNEYALSTSFDLSSAGFTTSFSVAAQETQPTGLALNNDGTKLYVVGESGDNVNEYALSTAFDVFSASFTTSFSVAAQEDNPRGLAFNNDGTKMYVVGLAGVDVNEYALSTAFDVFSASFTTSFPVDAQETIPIGLAFNNDGTKMYVVGSAGDDVNEYALSAAFDVSSASFTSSFSVAVQETIPTGLAFNNNGTKMYVVGRGGDAVYEYNLSSNAFTEAPANDGSVQGSLIVSLSNDTFVNASGTLTSPIHFTINNLPAGLTPSMAVAADGLTATLTLAGNATANQDADDVSNLQFTFADAAFSISSAAVVINATGPASSNLGIDFDILSLTYSTSPNISTATFSGISFFLDPVENAPQGVVFDPTGMKMFVVGLSSGGVNQYNLNTPYELGSANFITTYSVVNEELSPTGLTFNDLGTKMYVVGTDQDNINEYNLTIAYDISTASFGQSIPVVDNAFDPTGIAFSNDGARMLVSGAGGAEVYNFTLGQGFDISTATNVGIFPFDSPPLDPFLGNYPVVIPIVGDSAKV